MLLRALVPTLKLKRWAIVVCPFGTGASRNFKYNFASANPSSIRLGNLRYFDGGIAPCDFLPLARKNVTIPSDYFQGTANRCSKALAWTGETEGQREISRASRPVTWGAEKLLPVTFFLAPPNHATSMS